MNDLLELEDRILDLEISQLEKEIGFLRETSPSPKSAEAFVTVKRVGRALQYRTRDGKLLPVNRTTWPVEIREMVEAAEKINKERTRDGRMASMTVGTCELK